MKFGRLEDDLDIPHSYANVWVKEDLRNGRNRLIVAPSGRHIDCLLRLTECLPEPLYILYVLVVPRGEANPGRYESPRLTRQEMEGTFRSFEGFFQGDGRAAVWVTAFSQDGAPVGTLVYDRHDLIYAYGPIESYVQVLDEIGLRQCDSVVIPCPHSHHYNEEFDSEARRLHASLGWAWSALRPADEE